VPSVHFNFFDERSEQDLLAEMVAESISIYGHSCFYLPRIVVNRDELLTEPEFVTFDAAYPIDVYVKTTQQMGGEGALLAKFGVELRDELVVTIAMMTFKDEITANYPELVRPREGDLLFVPMIGSLFTIKYVDKKAFFYQLGSLQAWDLSLELYEDSSARFQTGVAEVDSMYEPFTQDVYEAALAAETGHLLQEPGDDWVLEWEDMDTRDDQSQNVEIEEAADELISWDDRDPFSTGGRY
jgi:hypothetical protein